MARPERYERVLTISESVYKALLTVYPKEFRDEYGLQMVRDFRDFCQEELERGGAAGFARLWGRTALDLATTALVERSSSRVNDEEVVVTERRLAGFGFVLLLAPLYFISASLLK